MDLFKGKDNLEEEGLVIEERPGLISYAIILPKWEIKFMAIYRNQMLFSDHYLKEILPQANEWKYVDGEKLEEILIKIQSLYEKKKKIIPLLKESQLEEEFIRPILRILGHIYTLHPSIHKVWEGAKEPDYAFYSSEETKKEASIEKAIAIGEAKRYGRPLDRKL